MKLLICLLIGYLVGMINPAYIVGKMRGVDVKHEGSCNAGASNAIMLMGKLIGTCCGLFDIFKAYVVYTVCAKLFPDAAAAGMVAGVGCMLGHIFPAWLKFNGGKGLACLGGTILAYDGKLFLLMLAIEIVLVLVTGYVCLVAITASLAFPVIYWLAGGQAVGIAGLVVITVAMLLKHRENLQRIGKGTEVRISYLWNKDKETERVNKNKGIQ